MNQVLVISLLAMIPLVMAGNVKVTPCGSGTLDVTIDVCKVDPCEIKRGTKGKMSITFTALADSKSLTAKLTATVAGLELPFPGFDSDACNGHVKCPLVKGIQYTYTYEMGVLQEYPKINTVFKLILTDDSGNQDVCFTMPVHLID